MSEPQTDAGRAARIAELRAALDRADVAVNDLCSGKLRWTMRVPADPDHDPDLIIADALGKARASLADIDEEALPSTAVLAAGLHAAQIGCKPNVPFCRASHLGHAERLHSALAAVRGAASPEGDKR